MLILSQKTSDTLWVLDITEGSPRSWKEVSEKDLGDIEIKLVDAALGIEQSQEIVITEEDLNKPQPVESPAEQAKRNREYWERYTLEQRELFNTQAQAIDEIYLGRQLQTPIVMDRHHRQEYIGQDGIWSCVVASSLNALHALGQTGPSDNETTIIQAVGGRSAFTTDGYLPMGRAYDYLRNRGLLVRDSGNMLELIQTLENGGVGLIVYGGHARLISGAENRQGQVMLRLNDPLRTEVELVPVKEMMKHINQTRNFYNMFLIETPPHIEITK